MVLRDFIDYDSFRYINEKINNKAKFEYIREVKGDKNKVKLRLDGRYISDDLVNDVWHGINYLVGMQIDYHGTAGIGGWSYCVNDYSNYKDWETFSNYIHGLLVTFSDYEREKKNEIFDQMSLF